MNLEPIHWSRLVLEAQASAKAGGSVAHALRSNVTWADWVEYEARWGQQMRREERN